MKIVRIQLLLLMLCNVVCMAQSRYTILTKCVEKGGVVSERRDYYENDTLRYSVCFDSQGVKDTITTEDYWDSGIFNFSFRWEEELRSKGIEIKHCELSPMDFERIALMVYLLDNPEIRKSDKTKKDERTICFYGPIKVFLKYTSTSSIEKETLKIRNGLLIEEITSYSKDDILGKRKEKREFYYDSKNRLIGIKEGKRGIRQIIYE